MTPSACTRTRQSVFHKTGIQNWNWDGVPCTNAVHNAAAASGAASTDRYRLIAISSVSGFPDAIAILPQSASAHVIAPRRVRKRRRNCARHLRKGENTSTGHSQENSKQCGPGGPLEQHGLLGAALKLLAEYGSVRSPHGSISHELVPGGEGALTCHHQ